MAYILVRGAFGAGKIVMNKEGRFITLRKEGNDKMEFKYDLADDRFTKIKHYKTKEDEEQYVRAGDVTSWFSKCSLVTEDAKFAKMFIFASSLYTKYRSPIRFIGNFGHYKTKRVEKWLSQGIDFIKLNKALEYLQNGRDILDVRNYCNAYIYYEPSDFDKEAIKYLRSLSDAKGGIEPNTIDRVHRNWDPSQYQMSKKLNKILEDQRYRDAFMVTEYNYRAVPETYDYLDDDRYSYRSGRAQVLEVMSRWNLEPMAFINYLLRLQHEAVSVLDLMRNYNDYLQREYEMKNQRMTKMNKYPANWMSHYHKHHFNYNAMKNLKRIMELEDKMKAYNEFKESKKYLEYKDDQYLLRLPENIEDIANEATQLGHCLYDQYTNKILDGETIILFMRRVDHPDESVATIEVKYNGIEQARGYKNADPTPEQQQWLLDWCSKKNLDRVIRQHY